MVRSLVDLMKKNAPVNCSLVCQVSFETIKIALTNSSIVIYPDPNKHHVLFTNASKHSWYRVLSQERVTSMKDRDMK